MDVVINFVSVSLGISLSIIFVVLDDKSLVLVFWVIKNCFCNSFRRREVFWRLIFVLVVVVILEFMFGICKGKYVIVIFN